MPRPTKVPDTAVQQIVRLFMNWPIEEAVEALNAGSAVVYARVEKEGYVPTTAAQDSPARPKTPRSTRNPRGRPPAADADTPPPPDTPPGAAPSGDPPSPSGEASTSMPLGPVVRVDAGKDGRLTGTLPMPAIGGSAASTDPVTAPGGRAPTT